ncbi:MAG: aspartyl protease family protein [Thermoprotei archaeon]
MVLVKACVKIRGFRKEYSTKSALVDTGTRITVLDETKAEEIGVEYTGRELGLISISGHRVKAREAIVNELVIEDETLKYEALAVAKIPDNVKRVLSSNNLDTNIIIGLLTLERANLVPDTTRGYLRKAEGFIL